MFCIFARYSLRFYLDFVIEEVLETLIQLWDSKVSGFPTIYFLEARMSTRMEGITQQSLFFGKTQTMEVMVTENNRYRVLAKSLPWRELGEVANAWRAKKARRSKRWHCRSIQH